MTRDDRRAALRERITQAQQRISSRPASDYARDTVEHLIEYAKAKPLVAVGAAVALGLALGSLTRRGRKAATATGLAGRVATEAAIAFALALYERASHRDDEAGAEAGSGDGNHAGELDSLPRAGEND